MNYGHGEQDIYRLLGAYCDGTLSEEDGAQLDALLQSDEKARQLYSEYLFLHADLHSRHATFANPDLHSEQLGGTEDDVRPTEEDDVLSLDDRSKAQRPHAIANTADRRRWFARPWTIAASLLVVALSSSMMTYVMLRTGTKPLVTTVDQDETGDSKRGEHPPIARITGTRNCRWANPAEHIGFGSRLSAGQTLELAAGLAEVTFEDGAKVILEGPARFDVEATDGAVLYNGRLAAVVPQRARGFEVATSRMNVIDLGTEFGMYVDKAGETEVHVFQGLVKAHLLNEAGQQVRTVRVTTAEAVRLEKEPNLLTRLRAADDEFVRSIAPAAGPHDGLYAYEAFDYPEGPLSGQNGGFGWAGPWADIEVGGEPGSVTNRVSVGNLAFEGLVPRGNRAEQTAQHNRIRRSLSTSIGGVFDAVQLVENQDGLRLIGRDNTTVYLSFLQRVTAIDDVFYGVELHRGDGNANRVLCVGNGAEGCGYGVTSNYNAYGLQNFPTLGQEDTEVNFVVVKVEFGPMNRDTVSIYRNPESNFDEADCKVDAVLKGNFAFDRISLGNFDGERKVHQVDELRVGTSYLAVTGRQAHDGERLLEKLAFVSPLRRSATTAFGPTMTRNYGTHFH